jgi:hypothetical protein
MTTTLPHCYTEHSSLGGHSSTFIKVSADPQDTWSNGIFHNSRYGIFSLADGKLELISKGLNTAKHRKCKCESEEIAMQKIFTWYQKTLAL